MDSPSQTLEGEEKAGYEIFSALPEEIQALIINAKGFYPLTLSQEFWYPVSREEREKLAGTQPPTLEEADKLHGYGIWCLFRTYANVLTAFTIPSWDSPDITSSYVIYTNTDGYDEQDHEIVHYVHGSTDFSSREEYEEGTGPVDQNLIANIKNVSLIASPDHPPTPWLDIPNDIEANYPGEGEFIFLDLQATYELLKDRFIVVSGRREAPELARKWTLNSFYSISAYIRSMSPDHLPLLMYLAMNAAVLDASFDNWLLYLWDDELPLTPELQEKIDRECDEITQIVLDAIPFLH